MILEYRINDHVWNMIDGDIAFCWFSVEDEIKKIKEKYSKDKLQAEITNIFRAKAEAMGYLTSKPHCKSFHTITEKEWSETKNIIIIVVHRENGYRVFVFDVADNVRICYNDGTIIREFGK